MTTYSYSIEISQLEMSAFKAAINHYLEHLDKLLSNDTTPQNEFGLKMQRDQLQSILERRHDNATMTSTNSFLHPDGLE